MIVYNIFKIVNERQQKTRLAVTNRATTTRRFRLNAVSQFHFRGFVAEVKGNPRCNAQNVKVKTLRNVEKAERISNVGSARGAKRNGQNPALSELAGSTLTRPHSSCSSCWKE